MSVRLFVGNLSSQITGQEIHDLFSTIGTVESCRLITDRETGQSRGFAFVEMNSREAADAAKEKLNGHDLQGQSLKVNEAKPKV